MFGFGMYRKTLSPEQPLAQAWADIRQLWSRWGLLSLLLASVVCAGFCGVFLWLEMPLGACWGFGGLLGLQAWLMIWLPLGVDRWLARRIHETRWQGDRYLWRGLLALLLVFLNVGMYWLWGRSSERLIWVTIWGLLLLSLGIYAFFTLTLAVLLRIQVYGTVALDFAERIASRLGWVQTVLCLLPFFLFFNIWLAMTWWHGHTIHDGMREQVREHYKHLSALRLKSLFDREGRYLGLFARTESDWSPHYNEPALLSWRVSRAIMMAEGDVQAPAWWWRYLPDGHRLLSEPFSIEAFLRVPYYFLKQRRKVGGSTPAVQAAKNFLDFGERRKGRGIRHTLQVKLFEELPRSYVLSQHLSPRELMATYMATLWSGHSNHYGLHRMSLYYFGVGNPEKLDWNQAIVLASSLPNPGHFNPWFLRSCWVDRCKNPRQQKVFDIWLTRITQIKQKLRALGIAIPETLPVFRNGLVVMRALAPQSLIQDSHLRHWIQKEKIGLPAWIDASAVRLSFHRRLTLGLPVEENAIPPHLATPTSQRAASQPAKEEKTALSQRKNRRKARRPARKNPSSRPARKKPSSRPASQPLPTSFLEVLQPRLAIFRQEIPTIQAAYTLVDARDGMIFSQYGGDQHVDLASSGKPIVGSTFKVMTMLVAGTAWPDRLPLVNRGEGSEKMMRRMRRFLYHTPPGSKGHLIRNISVMTPFLSKHEALRVSANIAFVYLSLRWTWMLPEEAWRDVMQIGLASMLRDRLQMPKKKTEEQVRFLLDDPDRLLLLLRDRLGYRTYLRGLRQGALFEAAKATAVQTLLRSRRASPRELARFLDASSLQGYSKPIHHAYASARAVHQAAWGRGTSLAMLSWNRDLRMELGLRYLIDRTARLTGLDPAKRHLLPVMTATLGVHDASNDELAAIAASVAAKAPRSPRIIRALYRGARRIYEAPPPLTASALPLAYEEVYRAMRATLRAGTAGRSGSQMARRFGARVLLDAGAKTGTVQNAKGVSCIGFLGHRAGAISLSTPDQQRLRRMRLRSSYVARLTALQKQRDAAKARYESNRSALHRLSLERAFIQAQRRVEVEQKRHDLYNERAQRFLRTGRIWRDTEQKADQARVIAETFARRARLHTRQARIYREYAEGNERMIALFDRWFARYHKEREDAFTTRTDEKKQADLTVERASQEWKDAEKRFRQESESLAIPLKRKRFRDSQDGEVKQRRAWHLALSEQCRGTRDVRGCQLRLLIAQRQPKAALRKDVLNARQALLDALAAQRRLHTPLQAAKRILQRALAAQRLALQRLHHATQRRIEKTPSYLKYQRDKARAIESRQRWLQRAEKEEKAAQHAAKQQAHQLQREQELLQTAKKQQDDFKRLEAQVEATHASWTLSSSQACQLLFALLAHWKESEEASAKSTQHIEP